MKYISAKLLAISSGICSIFGFFALFFGDKERFLIAVTVYSVAITAFFVAAYIFLTKTLSFKYRARYKRIAALNTFICDDNLTATFETRKIIQSKTPFLSEVDYERKWQGKNPPSKNPPNFTNGR